MTGSSARRGMVLVVCVGLLLLGDEAKAQVLGTFQWQTQPHCNVVTITIVQQGPVYQLVGSDDLCGTASAPLTGTAVVSGSGVALGMAVALPTGRTAHLSATVNLSSVSGSWTDSDGATGPFAFGPGNGSGSARPAPASAAAITSAQLSPAIFAGTGAATTVARSDHTHDARYYTKVETDTRIADATEVLSGPGVSLPATLSVQGGFSVIDDTVSTSAPGRLLVTKYINVVQNCTSGARLYYLTVDGVPLRSSAVYRGDGTAYSGQVTGVTTAVVAAGTHTLGVGGECFVRANYPGFGNVTLLFSASSVVVLP